MKKSNNTLIIVVSVLAVLVIALIVQNQMLLSRLPKAPEKNLTSEQKLEISQKIVDELSKFDSTKGKVPTSITLLESDKLAELKKQYPAIYGKAAVGNYLVQYTDLLVIYDQKSQSIVSQFVLQSMNFG